eukprot:937090-Ditylum_brightwellii.AAC.1
MTPIAFEVGELTVLMENSACSVRSDEHPLAQVCFRSMIMRRRLYPIATRSAFSFGSVADSAVGITTLSATRRS